MRNAEEQGATVAQVLPGSPKTYVAARPPAEPSRWDGELYVHASYVIGTTRVDLEKRRKTVTGAVEQLRWAEAVGARSLVVHPGSAWSDSLNAALLTIQRCQEVLTRYAGPVELHLENAATPSSSRRGYVPVDICRTTG